MHAEQADQRDSGSPGRAVRVGLAEIEAAAQAYAAAEAQLRAAVAVAVGERPANGLSVDEIAAAAGVGRQTAYRWAEEAKAPAPAMPSPATVMDDALAVLLAADAAARDELLAGLRSTDLRTKARHMLAATRNAPQDQLDEAHQRDRVEAGRAAASRILRRRA